MRDILTVHIPTTSEHEAEVLACEAYRRAFRKLAKVELTMRCSPAMAVEGHTSGYVVAMREWR